MQSKNIIHCNLKAANIFVGDNGEGRYLVKVGDFGTARFDFKQCSISDIPSATNNGSLAMCTAAYTAPELHVQRIQVECLTAPVVAFVVTVG